MDIQKDILLLYAEQDNQPIGGGIDGWVSNFHKFLNNLLSQVDREFGAVQMHSIQEVEIEKINNAGVVLAVVTDAFCQDSAFISKLRDWGTGLKDGKSLKVNGISRFFKILKSPYDSDSQLPEFADLIDYDFYYIDSVTGQPAEYVRFFGSDAEGGFWMKLVDVAYDIATIFKPLNGQVKKTKEKQYVYLANTGRDILNHRDIVKRELKRHGYEVLPNESLPKDAAGLEKSIKADLKKCGLSIHLIGEDYGDMIDESQQSIVDIQNQLAHAHLAKSIEANDKSGFTRLIWVSPDLKNVSERQRIFVEDLKAEASKFEEAEVLQVQLQEFKSVVLEEIETGGRYAARHAHENDAKTNDGSRSVYLIVDKADQEAIKEVQKAIKGQGIDVLLPLFDGAVSDIRVNHLQNLIKCDGAIVFHGNSTSEWTKAKLQDLLKAPGFGRDRPLRAKAVYHLGTDEMKIDHFEKYKADMLGGSEQFDPKVLAPFLTKIDQK
ncbi:MAG: DUF4062 domain-containing protein [Cyclobacteriaceae bacterium]